MKRREKTKTLSPKKAKFVELLVSGLSYREAGKKLGLSHTTAWRWSLDPAVQETIARMHAERLRATQGKLLEGVTVAVETLINLCHAKSGYVAVQAAKAILDLTLKLEETLNLQSRIEAIEERLRELEAKEA